MNLKQLFEASNTTAAMCFGRFNGVHMGHVKLFEVDKHSADNNLWFVGTSPTTHNKDNPLTYEVKKAWMEAFDPTLKGHIIPEVLVITLAFYINQHHPEVTDLIYVTDIEDWNGWSGKLLKDYNGVPDKLGRKYTFKSITHVQSPRLGSASALRKAAAEDDKKAFYISAAAGDPKRAVQISKLKVNGMSYFKTLKDAMAVAPSGTKKKITEEITNDELHSLEKYLNQFWELAGMDVHFSTHFLDRVNDLRNKKPITINELARLFIETYRKYAPKLKKKDPGFQAVLKDLKTDVNAPFVLVWNKFKDELELLAKTVIRKHEFVPNSNFEPLLTISEKKN